MKEEDIKQLLSEYNYNKNDLEATLEFLLIMCIEINKEINR